MKFDQPLYEFSEKGAFSPYHEELMNQPKKPRNQFPFKNDFVNQPLYAGWDEQLRKFVITNKFLPRTLAGYKVNIDNETRRKFSQDSTKQVQKIKFTAWPLSSGKVSIQKGESDIPYVTLFQPVDTKIQESLNIEGDFSTLPSNLERLLRLQAQKGEIQDITESLSAVDLNANENVLINKIFWQLLESVNPMEFRNRTNDAGDKKNYQDRRDKEASKRKNKKEKVGENEY